MEALNREDAEVEARFAQRINADIWERRRVIEDRYTVIGGQISAYRHAIRLMEREVFGGFQYLQVHPGTSPAKFMEIVGAVKGNFEQILHDVNEGLVRLIEEWKKSFRLRYLCLNESYDWRRYPYASGALMDALRLPRSTLVTCGISGEAWMRDYQIPIQRLPVMIPLDSIDALWWCDGGIREAWG